MTYLTQVQIQEIHRQAVQYTPGLLDAWKQLLRGLPLDYASTLPNIDSNKKMGLYNHLSSMNEVVALKGGIIPLESWLSSAMYFSEVFPESHALFRKYSLIVSEKYSGTEIAKLNRPAIINEIPEKIIYRDDLVPFRFAAAAERNGKSVVRLLVPRYENGQLMLQPFSDEKLEYFGTGWLIGSSYIITNYHVVNARVQGELDAAYSDLETQSINTSVQFDYDEENATGEIHSIKSLAAFNKSLDYAILELESPSERKPLTLYNKEFKLPTRSNIPVNLIQHPGGKPKKLGIRNNLIAASDAINIAYFTDTEPGSSGSPVCTDSWEVLALHKASTTSFGELEYQGKTTAYINIGTRISEIVNDLKENHINVWKKINPVLN